MYLRITSPKGHSKVPPIWGDTGAKGTQRRKLAAPRAPAWREVASPISSLLKSFHEPENALFDAVFFQLGIKQAPVDGKSTRRFGPITACRCQGAADQLALKRCHRLLERQV
jgi:hypothetical protein